MKMNNILLPAIMMMAITAPAQTGQPVMLSEPEINATGQFAVTLTDESTQTITGVLIQTVFSEAGHRRFVAHRYMDSAVDSRYTAIAPGSSRQIVLYGPMSDPRYQRQTSVEAVVFADGSIFGNQKAAQIILQRRDLLLRTLHDYEDVVRVAWATGGREEVLQDVAREHDKLHPASRAQQRGIALDTVNDQVAQLIKVRLGLQTDVCDAQCSDQRVSDVLMTMARWEGRIAASKPQTAAQPKPQQ